MRLKITIFLLTVLIFSCNEGKEEDSIEHIERMSKIKLYSDTIADQIILSFNYPEDMILESVDNMFCVDHQQFLSHFDPIGTDRFCGVHYRNKIGLIDSLVNQKMHLSLNSYNIELVATKDTIEIAGIKSLRTTFKQKNDNKLESKIVHVVHSGFLFEFVNFSDNETNYKKIIKSIKLNSK